MVFYLSATLPIPSNKVCKYLAGNVVQKKKHDYENIFIHFIQLFTQSGFVHEQQSNLPLINLCLSKCIHLSVTSIKASDSETECT